jgi:DNA-binding beta-propeller fold protein YncE
MAMVHFYVPDLCASVLIAVCVDRRVWPHSSNVAIPFLREEFLMLRGNFSTKTKHVSLLTALIILVATALISVEPGASPQIARSAFSARINPTGEARLIKADPLPQTRAPGAPMCEWQPASSEDTLVAMLQQRQEARAASLATRETINRSDLKPVRMIKDPYAAYSAVAVDPVNNEVVMTDENLFQILVYDRLANTPPTAKMTEPKRIISGENTKIEFQCGLYIDPKNGDIYAVNNDTVDTLVIFSRNARGNVPADRELRTPHGTFGIAVDESAEEMYLTTQHDNTVTVFKKYATGEESPVRLLQGDKTNLADPHGLAIDTKQALMFVANHGSFHEKVAGGSASVTYVGGMASDAAAAKKNWPVGAQAPGSGKYLPPSINIYPLKAAGNTAPLRVITGPKTQMNWPTGLAVDETKSELYVANDMGDSILVFDYNASGDVAPKRVLKGPKTMVKNPTGLWLDMKNNELWVANFGNHTATVYPIGASGDTAPKRMIRSGPMDEPSLGIGNPHPVAYDSKRQEILVPN